MELAGRELVKREGAIRILRQSFPECALGVRIPAEILELKPAKQLRGDAVDFAHCSNVSRFTF